MSAHEATLLSHRIRLERGQLHRDVDQGHQSLASLIEHDHPAIRGVRCYQLAQWLHRVGETKATHLVRGLPGHLPLQRLAPDERAKLLLRVRVLERRTQRAGVA